MNKTDQIIKALENECIYAKGVEPDGSIRLDLGYLLQTKSWMPGRFILWRCSPKVPMGRLEAAFTCKGKGWARQLARLVGSADTQLRDIFRDI
jgi:hypothetical protein